MRALSPYVSLRQRVALPGRGLDHEQLETKARVDRTSPHGALQLQFRCLPYRRVSIDSNGTVSESEIHLVCRYVVIVVTVI